jgi:hypothetical protein
MSGIESALEGLARLVTNARRPLPNPYTLGDFHPVVDHLDRERGTDIVWQKQADPAKPFDGGDSAHRTGVLAFCGSELDARNLPKFFLSDASLAVRHPTQEPWNNPNNFTRDQLTGYMAGCWRAGRTDIAKALFFAHEKRGFLCQNFEDNYPGTPKDPPVGDPLGPHDIMYLRVCTGDFDAVTDIASQLALYTSIQFLSNDLDTEINQPLLQAIVCCQLDIFLAKQDKYKAQLIKYWDGDGVWRGQREIADALISVVEMEKARYVTPDILDYLLPANILNELRHININDALNAFKTGNPVYFAELAGKLVIATLRDIKHYAEVVIYGVRTLMNIAEEVGTAILKTLQYQVSKELRKLDNFLKDLGPLHAVSVALNTAASLLGLGSSQDDADRKAELQFRQEVLIGLQSLSKDTSQILTNVATLQKDMERNFEALAVKVDGDFYKLVLSELEGHALEVGSLINSLNAEPGPSDAEKGRIEDMLGHQVENLKVAVGKCTDYGAPALPAAFHAYGIVIAGLTILNNVVVLRETRRSYREPFQKMLIGPKGLQSTITSLDNEVAAAYAAFDKVRAKILIGAVSVRLAEQYNMDDTKDINAIEKYWVTKVYGTLQGSVESGPFSISYSTEDGGEVPYAFVARDGENGLSVFSSAMFETPPFYGGRGLDKYHSPDMRERQINARDTTVAKIVSEGGAALTQWLQLKRATVINAKSILPGHRTLYAAVAATFDEQPIPGSSVIQAANAFGQSVMA